MEGPKRPFTEGIANPKAARSCSPASSSPSFSPIRSAIASTITRAELGHLPTRAPAATATGDDGFICIHGQGAAAAMRGHLCNALERQQQQQLVVAVVNHLGPGG